jgi:hypothetical protein
MHTNVPYSYGSTKRKEIRKDKNQKYFRTYGRGRDRREAFGTLLWVNIEDFLKMRKIYIYGFWGNGVFGAHI